MIESVLASKITVYRCPEMEVEDGMMCVTMIHGVIGYPPLSPGAIIRKSYLR